MEAIRLNKYLADCGVCSRRDADKLIEEGAVILNGKPARTGERVSEKDTVLVRGRRLERPDKKAVLAYYKPAGVTCTERDKFAGKTITDVLDYPVRVTYAGRLDRDSEGLILMTNDGILIRQMMKASQHHEKEYVVKVQKEITQDFLEKMRAGVRLKELKQTTRPCSVTQDGKYTFHIILTQGLNRQIRRMCETLGYRVQQLKRIRVLNIELGTLKRGEYRVVEGKELEMLYEQAGMAGDGTRMQERQGKADRSSKGISNADKKGSDSMRENGVKTDNGTE